MNACSLACSIKEVFFFSFFDVEMDVAAYGNHKLESSSFRNGLSSTLSNTTCRCEIRTRRDVPCRACKECIVMKRYRHPGDALLKAEDIQGSQIEATCRSQQRWTSCLIVASTMGLKRECSGKVI